jgi:uncharacterized protein YnzC (UPF0291/DUF896 family)
MITPTPSFIDKEIEAVESLKKRTVSVWNAIKWAVITITCVSASYLFYEMKQKTDLIPAISEQITQTAMSISEVKRTQTEQVKAIDEQGKDIKELKISLRILRKRDPSYSKKLDEINEYIRENKEQSFIPNIKLEDFINNFDTITPGKRELKINAKKL